MSNVHFNVLFYYVFKRIFGHFFEQPKIILQKVEFKRRRPAEGLRLRLRMTVNQRFLCREKQNEKARGNRKSISPRFVFLSFYYFLSLPLVKLFCSSARLSGFPFFVCPCAAVSSSFVNCFSVVWFSYPCRYTFAEFTSKVHL